MYPSTAGFVFISYSRKDTDVMRRIVSHLRGQGVNAWVDNEKLIPGTPIWEREIERAIKGCFAIVVVLSPDAKDSEWVLNELTLGDEYKKRVFPVLARGDFRDAVPFRLVTRQFVDIRKDESAGLSLLSTAVSRFSDELKSIEEERQATQQEAERLWREREVAERAAREAEEERITAQKAEARRLVHERAREAELLEKDKAEKLAAQRAEEERLAGAKLESERRAEEKWLADEAEKERKAKEKAKRLADEKTKVERLAAQKVEEDRLTAPPPIGTVQDQSQNTTPETPWERVDRLAREKENAEKIKKREAFQVASHPAKTRSPVYFVLMIPIGILTLLGCLILFFSNRIIAAQNANATATAAVKTAIVRLTRTAAAQLTGTTTPRPTNTSLPTPTNTPEILVVGPVEGSLTHDSDGFIETQPANVEFRDFIATATFYNPYVTTTGSWDYGFLFRDDGANNQYRLVITSDGWWVLRNNSGSPDGEIVQEGQSSNWNAGVNEANIIWLYCQGNRGILYVNGDFVADLDLSARKNAGDVSVATGLYSNNEIAGYSTEYDDFTVRKIPLAFGPEAGSLDHDVNDGFIESSYANLDSRDFVVSATALNPYDTTTGSWDYGFIFRDEGAAQEYRLSFTSAGRWNLRHYTGTASGGIIQEGELSNWNVAANGSNTIWLYCQGNKGILFVNGDYISDLDLSARMNSGDIGIATGFYTGDEIDGFSTNYEDFTVWEIP